jgi:hypothetical protein
MKSILTLTAFAALTMFAALPANAQAKKATGTDCKAVISSSGGQRPTEAMARGAALSVWKNEVKSQFGEQYQEEKFAKEVKYRCSSATAGLKRCSMSGIPCRVPEAGATPEPAKKEEPKAKKKG